MIVSEFLFPHGATSHLVLTTCLVRSETPRSAATSWPPDSASQPRLLSGARHKLGASSAGPSGLLQRVRVLEPLSRTARQACRKTPFALLPTCDASLRRLFFVCRCSCGGAKASGTLPPSLTFINPKNTILCGGSLGSCVDEERSQLR